VASEAKGGRTTQAATAAEISRFVILAGCEPRLGSRLARRRELFPLHSQRGANLDKDLSTRHLTTVGLTDLCLNCKPPSRGCGKAARRLLHMRERKVQAA